METEIHKLRRKIRFGRRKFKYDSICRIKINFAIVILYLFVAIALEGVIAFMALPHVALILSDVLLTRSMDRESQELLDSIWMLNHGYHT